MELTFEVVSEIASGSYPDAIQFYDTSAQVFSVKNGDVIGIPTLKVNGDWESTVFEDEIGISPDTDITNFEVKQLNGFGLVGSCKSNNTHKMLIYEFARDVSRYLQEGTINYSSSTETANLNITFKNPIDKSDELKRRVFMDPYQESILEPGAKIILTFSMGTDGEPIEMGNFYIDRSSSGEASDIASAECRNRIGKTLIDQNLCENNVFPLQAISETLRQMLLNANLTTDEFIVQDNTTQCSFEFEPNMTVRDSISEVLKITTNWIVGELPDGTIVIGEPSFYAFIPNGNYQFAKDHEVFRREYTADDNESYRRVCVYTQDWGIQVYRDVLTYKGWNLADNKTLFVNMPDGTNLTDATAYAEEIASRLSEVGRIETFDGPFRPQLQIKDEAIVTGHVSGNISKGLITDISLRFGENGFFTSFVTDSGGKLGKGRISDYITKITQPRGNGSIGYE